MKALGIGFHLPPKSFGFKLSQNEIRFQADLAFFDPNAYHFKLLRINNIYQVAICSGGVMPKVSTYRMMADWSIEGFEAGVS